MKITKTNVVINDYDKDLLAILKADYDERISEVKRVAQAQRISLLEENMMTSRKKEEARMERALKRKRKALSQVRVSKAHSELQKQNERKETYLKKGLSLIEKEVLALDEKTKCRLVNILFEELKTSIEEAGFAVKDFVFSVYKGVKIPRAEAELQELAVIAKKGSIRFTDSLKDRLKERELGLKEVLIGSLK